MEKYNLDKLVKVKVNDFYPSRYFIFRKEKKSFWDGDIEEGYYNKFSDSLNTKKIPEHHKIIDGKLFEIPEVILYFTSDIQTTKHFDTLTDAVIFAKGITKGKNWLLN